MLRVKITAGYCFNTQPPEGGWSLAISFFITGRSFNTQPPEGGWKAVVVAIRIRGRFNTQPPEGGWVLHEDVVKYLTEFQHTAA